ncbi:hypothetical protein LFL96_14095 [Paraburkholderia sp. D15]|uniref:hypothetical protein n=1 Tax=Paraburkholderia sp. D15 TaxID=2880218 RepID=UPI002478AB26|nr:hypothetical protein [Paraburkholderia sp. D15]WGS48900.1 hypothetical protein LFL96_14095 [Paraburkholderia sp. D15]
MEKPDVQSGPQAEKQSKRTSTLARSVLATVAFAGLITAGAFYTSGNPLFAAYSGDSVSASDRNARIAAFNSLHELQVSTVDSKDMAAALDAMHLAPPERARLAAETGVTSGNASVGDTHASATAASAENDKAATLPNVAAHAVQSGHAASPAPMPAPAAAANAAQLTLAWVRLWDTDVEDGDVVRIESAGYSRTVTLTNRGTTFAVPVPANGQIHIVGVRDGDGGGITVGLASGAAQAVLPIMSVGQVLTLNVRTK